MVLGSINSAQGAVIGEPPVVNPNNGNPVEEITGLQPTFRTFIKWYEKNEKRLLIWVQISVNFTLTKLALISYYHEELFIENGETNRSAECGFNSH